VNFEGPFGSFTVRHIMFIYIYISHQTLFENVLCNLNSQYSVSCQRGR